MRRSIIDRNKEIISIDRGYIWHPFTQMKDWVGAAPVIIESGERCYLKDIDGRWYLDGVSSLWVNIHGHRVKEIDRAIRRQLKRVAHSTMLGLGGVAPAELAQRLVKLLNYAQDSPNKVFYSDNGSTAVEVALKMAFQYWVHKGVKGRNTFLSLNNAYHGDTLGAVSVGGIDLFHSTFAPLLFRTYKSPSPYCYRCELKLRPQTCSMACLFSMEEILRQHADEIAAVIIEPLIQAAGGMITAPKGFLSGVRRLCDRYGTLLIADEVATGFGRTGRMFACEHEDCIPDIICLSKGITGGYMPLAVTVAREFIYNAFLGEFSELKTFFHGHSYTGNPLACAAATACLDIFDKDGTLSKVQPLIDLISARLEKMRGLKYVGDVRNAGLMAGIELVRDKDKGIDYLYEERAGWKVTNRLRERGVITRPLGNVLVIMPPLAITEIELSTMLDMVESSIEEALD